LRLQSQKGNNIEITSIAGQFLFQLQWFLSQYCFCDKDCNNKLHDDSSFILQRALYAECPQQKNPNDCSLFAFAILLHLAHGLPITQDVFTQQHITQCRLGLASELSTIPVPSLRPEFLSSFFPKLSNGSQLALSPARFTTNNPTCSSETGLVKKQAVDYTLKETENPTESNILKDIPTADLHFRDLFLKTPSIFSDWEQIDRLVEQYEAISGFHIVISKSGWNARTYICKSHVDCCFRAKFGPSRGKESIVLKATISYDFHCGENIVGPFYRRMKCKIRRSVDNVTLVKDENPKPKDVMKVAANIDFITTTYHQSYRAIDRITSETNVKNLRSFQLIMPYTKKFLDKG
jgi:hypothetical protein